MDDPAAYGEQHAEVYDRIYGSRFDPSGPVAALATAADGGAVLELGVGTGRLAIALATTGVDVDGIEASPAMIGQLGARPGGDRVGIYRADLADFELPRTDYRVAVCAVSTLFMLTRDGQAGCLRATYRHLAPGGRLFVEAFVPDSSRFDPHGRREEHRTAPDGGVHVVRSRHDPNARSIDIVHELAGAAGERPVAYGVTLRYSTPDELDALAAAAGFEFEARWHDWSGRPAGTDSRDPVSVYRR